MTKPARRASKSRVRAQYESGLKIGTRNQKSNSKEVVFRLRIFVLISNFCFDFEFLFRFRVSFSDFDFEASFVLATPKSMSMRQNHILSNKSGIINIMFEFGRNPKKIICSLGFVLQNGIRSIISKITFSTQKNARRSKNGVF